MAVLFRLSLVSCSKESLDSEQSSASNKVSVTITSRIPVSVTIYNGRKSSNIVMDKRYSGGDRVYYYFLAFNEPLSCTSIKVKSDASMGGCKHVYGPTSGELMENFKDVKEFRLDVPSDATDVDIDICKYETRSSVADNDLSSGLDVYLYSQVLDSVPSCVGALHNQRRSLLLI